jgi:hypothetical protein
MDTYKKKPKDEAFSSSAIVKKPRRGDGKPMGSLPRQMKDPKKDAMVSKGGKVKVIDKDKEKDHLKKGFTRAESIGRTGQDNSPNKPTHSTGTPMPGRRATPKLHGPYSGGKGPKPAGTERRLGFGGKSATPTVGRGPKKAGTSKPPSTASKYSSAKAEMNDVPKTMKRPPMPQKGLLPPTVKKGSPY